MIGVRVLIAQTEDRNLRAAWFASKEDRADFTARNRGYSTDVPAFARVRTILGLPLWVRNASNEADFLKVQALVALEVPGYSIEYL